MTTLPNTPAAEAPATTPDFWRRVMIYTKVYLMAGVAAFIILTAHHVTQLIPLAPEDSRFWLSSAVGIVTGFLVAGCILLAYSRLAELAR